MRPIFPTASVNHRLPSGPDVISVGPLLAVGVGNKVIVPEGVIRPILDASEPSRVNQRLPSGPAVMSSVAPLLRGTLKVVNLPAVVIFTIRPARSVNQRFPSGPLVICQG